MPTVGTTTAHEDDVNRKVACMSHFLTELPHLKVPYDFPNLIEGFAREVLRHQPPDILQFGMTYFEEKLNQRPGRRGLAGLRKTKQRQAEASQAQSDPTTT